MSLIRVIDQGVQKLIYSIFWWLIDPLEKERIFSQLKDKIHRNLDVNHPDKTLAPDNFEILVNNQVFIKHAHAIKKLEEVLADQIQKYVADCDYELLQPTVTLKIESSATLSKRKAEIRTWFSAEDAIPGKGESVQMYRLKVIDGEGKGLNWELTAGNVYKIGRVSSADICLPFEKISKIHATIYFVAENNIAIVDEASANGTFIDDEQEQIKGSRDLQPGSQIRFCYNDPVVMIFVTE